MRRCIRFRKRSTISAIARTLTASPLSDLVLSSMYLSCANSSASSKLLALGQETFCLHASGQSGVRFWSQGCGSRATISRLFDRSVIRKRYSILLFADPPDPALLIGWSPWEFIGILFTPFTAKTGISGFFTNCSL